MPPRRRREPPPRRWPTLLLAVAGVLMGAVLWAYAPDLPAEALTQRYATAQSSFIDVGGVRTHLRDTGAPPGNPDAIPLVLIHGSLESLDVWDGWVEQLSAARARDHRRPAGPWPHRPVGARRVHDRRLRRLHRGAGRHLAPRPLRAGRPFDGRRGGVELRLDAAGTGEPSHPGRFVGLPGHRQSAAVDSPRTSAGDRRHRHLLQARQSRARDPARCLRRSGDGDARAGEALRRAAALSRQPPRHPAAACAPRSRSIPRR